MGRLERWETERYFRPPVLHSDDESVEAFLHLQEQAQEREGEEGGVLATIIGLAKEIVLVVDPEGNRYFRVVGFAWDPRFMDLSLGVMWEISDEGDKESAKRTLANAMAEEVPVYPDDDRAATELARLHVDLLTNGFETEIEGSKVRLSLNEEMFGGEDHVGGKGSLVGGVSLPPAQALLERARAIARERELVAADTVLANLRSAIKRLRSVLAKPIAREQDIQSALTDHPILFGLDYVEVIPQHRLGSDFVMDYALQRHSGLVDLVEIERFDIDLYTRSGNPRSQLVHAEQQVLDWLHWMSDFGSYARKDLPTVVRPRAYVVIGSRERFNAGDHERLINRNQAWGETIEIMTYEDLLDRAESIESVLTGAHEESNL